MQGAFSFACRSTFSALYFNALMSACLICLSHGRRVAPSSVREQRSLFTESKKISSPRLVAAENHADGPKSGKGTLDSLKALVMSLLAFKLPVAFNLFRIGRSAPVSSTSKTSTMQPKPRAVRSYLREQVSMHDEQSADGAAENERKQPTLSSTQELRGGKTNEDGKIESVHLQLTKQFNKYKASVPSSIEGGEGGEGEESGEGGEGAGEEKGEVEGDEDDAKYPRDITPFMQFMDTATNETLVALTGHTNRTRLELFGWHVHARNFSEPNESIGFHSLKINVTDPAQREMLKNLWDNERLLTPTSNPFADASGEKRRSFKEFLSDSERRMNVIPEDINAHDAALESFMDEHAARLDGVGWRALRYQANFSRDEVSSQVKRVMVWFKDEFPYYHGACQMCPNSSATSTSDVFLGYVHPSAVESASGANASRTELYFCNCNSTHISRFPRYKAVNSCLETRRGRCGEYSVLALRMLQLLDYRCRYTVDYDDHVWVEVMHGIESPPIHADPCEAAVDEPLIYQGWGKNQTFIISFPMDLAQEVEDVTHVYTSNFSATLSRRLDMDESPEKVAAALADLNERRRLRRKNA